MTAHRLTLALLGFTAVSCGPRSAAPPTSPESGTTGYIVVAKGFGEQPRHDLGVLAVVEDGAIVAQEPGALAELGCTLFRPTNRFDVVAPSRMTLEIASAPASNEANRCVGQPVANPRLTGDDLVAVHGLSVQPIERMPELSTQAAVDLARAALLRESKGVLDPTNYTDNHSTSSWRMGARTFDVVEVEYTPAPGCQVAACRFGADMGATGEQRGVVVLERTDAGLAERLVRVRVVDRQDPGEPYGLVSFVGFVAPVGATDPWVVLLWDGGPSWEFELAGSTGQGRWQPISLGGGASTI